MIVVPFVARSLFSAVLFCSVPKPNPNPKPTAGARRGRSSGMAEHRHINRDARDDCGGGDARYLAPFSAA